MVESRRRMKHAQRHPGGRMTCKSTSRATTACTGLIRSDFAKLTFAARDLHLPKPASCSKCRGDHGRPVLPSDGSSVALCTHVASMDLVVTMSPGPCRSGSTRSPRSSALAFLTIVLLAVPSRAAIRLGQTWEVRTLLARILSVRSGLLMRGRRSCRPSDLSPRRFAFVP